MLSDETNTKSISISTTTYLLRAQNYVNNFVNNGYEEAFDEYYILKTTTLGTPN